MLNVDGYIYTRQFDGDRMWRKNRQPNPGSSCIGTDGNRNYQYKWGQAGSSSSPCAETYKGPFPYSTAEASSVTNFIIKTPNVVSYIDFHSYSQFIMLPTGPVCKTYVKDYTDLLAASTSAVAALKAVTGTVFQTRAFCGPSDAANGSSEDNAYNLGVKYSYTAELRDTGSYGFILPATQIRASGEEMIKAITALWLYADAH